MLEQIDSNCAPRLVLSVNGSDDELAYIGDRVPSRHAREPLAVVVGTQGYKALHDSYRVFEMLRTGCAGLTLKVIGRRDWVPPDLRTAPGLVLAGLLERPQVIENL